MSRWTFLQQEEHCNSVVAEQLAEWRAKAEFFRNPPLPGVQVRYRVPTNEPGHWVTADFFAGDSTKLSLITPHEVRQVTLSPECEPSTDTTTIDRIHDDAVFTDADLISELDQSDKSVIYVWSPHMPLSVDGFREIQTVTQELGFNLVPVLFGASDPTFAREEARRVGIPQDGLAELRAIELVFRDAHVHAPTIIVFADHRVSVALPGYRNAAGYKRFIEDFLRGDGRAEIGR